MWAALKQNFEKGFMYRSHTFIPTHPNTIMAVLAGVKLYHRRVSWGIFLVKAIRVFSVSIKIIDGASDVYSLRRRESSWQYNMGTFAPINLNKRAAGTYILNWICVPVELSKSSNYISASHWLSFRGIMLPSAFCVMMHMVSQ